MRLAIISDTHMGPGGRRRLPDRCEELIAGSDLLLHAGDIMTLEALAEIEAIGPPVRAVAGNMDGWDLRERLPATDEVEAAGARLAVLHDAGPSAGRLERMRRRFPGVDAVVFGHSHIPLHDARGRLPALQSRQPDRAAPGAIAFDGPGTRGGRADRAGAGRAVNLRCLGRPPGPLWDVLRPGHLS